MRRRWLAIPVLALAAFSAMYISFASADVFQQDSVAASGSATCETKHCKPNTHCCYGCTASPICVKNGVPCPECAPQ